MTGEDGMDGYVISRGFCVLRRGEENGGLSVSVVTRNQENGEKLHQMDNHYGIATWTCYSVIF